MKAWLSLLVSSFSLLSACAPTTNPTPVVPPVEQVLPTFTTSGNWQWAFSPDTNLDKVRNVSVNLTIPSGGGTVYYLLTNTSTVASYAPVVGSVLGAFAPRSAMTRPGQAQAGDEGQVVRTEYPQRWLGQKLPSGTSSRALVTGAAPPPMLSSVGDSLTFKDHDIDTGALIATPTHLRKKGASVTVAGHTRTLNLWVADDCWDGDGNGSLDESAPVGVPWSPPDHFVTSTMLDALSARFLSDGTNDIYSWVTSIFGPEWSDAGSSPSAGLIDGNNEIHIFIKNLNPTEGDGILMGYFDPSNSIVPVAGTWYADSNQRVLFALDADTLANPSPFGTTEPTTWTINNDWPAEAVSTLAHEFQHMIHFYRKQVLQNLDWTHTWINEMASMMTEDLVADKLGVPGPRGVTGFDTGTVPITKGRLPAFNYWHESIPLTGWGSGGTVLTSYSNAYAFGAWLLRNYGGPTLLHDLVNNSSIDYQAVIHAVNTSPVTVGQQQTYLSLVRDWGLATFLKSSSVRAGLRYRDDDTDADVSNHDTDPNRFKWAFADDNSVSHDYFAGSIDLAKYRYTWGGTNPGSYDGPYIYQSGTTASTDKVAAGASYFYKQGIYSGSSVFADTLTLPAQVALTVVIVSP